MSYQDPNAIVNVTVSTITAPYPASLQQTGAIVSFGATNLPTAPSQSFLTQFADLAPLLPAPNTLQAATWNSGVLTMTATNPLPAGLADGDDFEAVFTGWLPATLNGKYTCTVVDITTNRFSTPMAVDPGIPTQGGTFIMASANELSAQVATYFRQGTGVGVWLLELGYQKNVIADEVAALESWITSSTGQYYGYLVPSDWGLAANIPDVLPLYQQFNFPEAMTYFWTTIELAAVGLIDNTNKCVIQLVEAPTVAAARLGALPGTYAEFTIAGMMYIAMKYKATAISRVSPMCFKYIYGVTPYPLPGNGPLLVNFKNQNVNYIQTGAQGGIAYTNIFKGVTADGQDYFNWWWTLDWVQITINLNVSNAVINGSNNPTSPLYYNQFGINYLETILANTMIQGVQYGAVVGPVVQTQLDPVSLADAISAGTYATQCNVNAVPFATYTALNPSDYASGEYDGLSTLFIPSRGFVHIMITVVATNIVTL